MKTYDLTEFASIVSAKQLVSAEIVVGELPTLDEVKTLANWNKAMLDLFDVSKEQAQGSDFDRSGAIVQMAYFGAENGWTDPQIMRALISLDDKWEKYTDRTDREKRFLLPILNKARIKHGYTPMLDIDGGNLKKDSAFTEDEQIVYGAQDFVDAEFKIEWILQGLMAQSSIGLIVAYPGTGKTQLGLQLGCSLALGLPKFLMWPNMAGKKKVLFMSLEMGKNSFHLFMSTIIETYSDRKTLNKNLMIAPIGRPVPIDTKEGQALLDNLLSDYMPDIIIFDSLQMIISKEMTDELAVKNLFHYLSNIRGRYGCSIVMIHHMRKASADARKKDEITLSDVYGSYLVTGDPDFVLSMKQTPTIDILTVELLKNRLGTLVPPFEIVRDKHLNFSSDLDNLNMLKRDNDD